MARPPDKLSAWEIQKQYKAQFVHLEFKGEKRPLLHQVEHHRQSFDLQPSNQEMPIVPFGKIFILYHPAKSKLNQRSELFSKFLHKAKNLIYNLQK